MTDQPADNAAVFNASQIFFNRISPDGQPAHYELVYDTYENGWHRVVLDPDVAAILLAQAAHWNRQPEGESE